ncbi:transforming growth factor-beta-induced protein ig-h3-like isoform X1 [Dinothrombium tinctorium]|uniref:Transforming growth factor-beta-induced protein ig-h3-like isoform X1 n=1 Tax=Dinothrombium tinctorium TaxID=1965070 RepID=A0A443QHH7_9ACAR|nr:transforming growth factor-beta-induced protein ig-h3-like isoform X1 [Dinothrombium tinctorium]
MLESFEAIGDDFVVRDDDLKESASETFNPPVVVVDKGAETEDSIRDPFFPLWSTRRDRPFKSWIFNFRRQEPWWKGPNVCVERKVIDGSTEMKKDVQNLTSRSSFTFSSQTTHCFESETSYVCSTHIKETLKDMGMTRFLETLESFQKLASVIDNENVTVFSPPNDAWIDFTGYYNKKENEIPIMGNERSVARGSLENVINRHLFVGMIKSGDLDDGQILTSLNNQSKTIVNVYTIPKKVVTINCAPIITANTHATNGMVHIIDRVLPQVNATIGDIIEKEPRFSFFRELMKKSGVLQKLKNQDNHFTAFIPTDDILKKVDPNLLEKLRKGHPCFNSIVESHIIEKIFCTSGIFNQIKINSMASHSLTLKRNYEQKLFVEDIEILERDMMGTNGVIHVIGNVVIPETVKPVSKVLQNSITSEFVKLLNKSNLLDDLDAKLNATFFIPTNDALKQLKNAANRTEEIYNNHIFTPKMKTDNFYNNEMIESLSGKSMRINLYGLFPEPLARTNIQCSNVIYQNRDVCGGVIHVVDKLIFPSEENVLKILDSSENFTIFRKIVKVSGMESKLKGESGPFTLLVPKDEVFRQLMTKEQLYNITNDPKKAVKLIQKHILPEFVCCSGVSQMPLLFSLQQFRALDGSSISSYRDFEGKIKFGPANVRQCDLIAENGIIHVIDKILQPRKPPTSSITPFFHIFMN